MHDERKLTSRKKRIITGVAILNIDVVQDNGETRKVPDNGHIQFSYPYRRTQLLIGLRDELTDDPLFKQEHGNHQGCEKNPHNQGDINKKLPVLFQA